MLWYAQKLLILFNKYGKTASPLANVTQRRQYCTDLMTGSLLGFKLNFKHVSGRSMTTTIINLNQFYILELARSKCFPFANLNRSEVAQYTSTSWFHRVFANEIKKKLLQKTDDVSWRNIGKRRCYQRYSCTLPASAKVIGWNRIADKNMPCKKRTGS